MIHPNCATEFTHPCRAGTVGCPEAQENPLWRITCSKWTCLVHWEFYPNQRLMFPRDLITKTLLTAVCAAALAQAHSAGATQSASGVPGEGDCTACHTLTSIGTGSIALTFSDTTKTYQPGVSQHIKMTITDSSAKRWGFQITARLQANQQLQGGLFKPGTDSQLFCTNIGGVNYSLSATPPCPTQQPLVFVEQTFDGTKIDTKQPGSTTYEFDWIPPTDSNAGTVILYVGALASNNDGAIAGDITYNTRVIVRPAVVPNLPVVTAVLNPSNVQSTITSGALITIQGTGLSSTSRAIGPSDLINGQYPQTADGVGVTIAGVPAYLVSIDPGSIKAIVPRTDALGLVNVVVTNANQTSVGFLTDLEMVAPAFFLWGNTAYVMAFHLDGSPVAPVGAAPGASPAKPGESIVITATGLGLTNPDYPAGIVVPAATLVTLIETPLVLFNGLGTLSQGAALVPGTAGTYGVLVQVPSDAPDGDLSVQVQVSGVQSDPGFVIPVKK